MTFHYFYYYYYLICFLSFASFVKGITWFSCGDETDPVKLTSLKTYENGSKILFLSGTGKSAINLTSPIEAQLEVKKKFFWGWTRIPCVDNFGSCNYEDVCTLSPYLNKPCPADFVKNHLPCKCPILQGQYSVKTLPLDLSSLPHWIEKGTYRIKITLTKNDKRLICLVLTQTISKKLKKYD